MRPGPGYGGQPAISPRSIPSVPWFWKRQYWDFMMPSWSSPLKRNRYSYCAPVVVLGVCKMGRSGSCPRCRATRASRSIREWIKPWSSWMEKLYKERCEPFGRWLYRHLRARSGGAPGPKERDHVSVTWRAETSRGSIRPSPRSEWTI